MSISASVIASSVNSTSPVTTSSAALAARRGAARRRLRTDDPAGSRPAGRAAPAGLTASRSRSWPCRNRMRHATAPAARTEHDRSALTSRQTISGRVSCRTNGRSRSTFQPRDTSLSRPTRRPDVASIGDGLNPLPSSRRPYLRPFGRRPRRASATRWRGDGSRRVRRQAGRARPRGHSVPGGSSRSARRFRSSGRAVARCPR